MLRTPMPDRVLARIVDIGIRAGQTVRSLANVRPGGQQSADVLLNDLCVMGIDEPGPHEVRVAAGHSALNLCDTLALAGREVPGLPRVNVPVGAAATAGLYAGGLATPPLSDAVRSWTGVLVDRGRAQAITLLRGRDDTVLDAVLAGHGRLGMATRIGFRTRELKRVAPCCTTEPWKALRTDLLLHAAHRDRVRLRLASDHPDRVERVVGHHVTVADKYSPWVVPVLRAAVAIDTLRRHAASEWRLDVSFVGSSRVPASPFRTPSAVLCLTGGGDRQHLDAHINHAVGDELSACPIGVADLPVCRFVGPAPTTRVETWRALAHPVFAEPLGDAIKQFILPEA